MSSEQPLPDVPEEVYAAYRAVGVTEDLEPFIPVWVEQEHSPEDVQPYLNGPEGKPISEPSWIADLLLHGVPADIVFAYQDAGCAYIRDIFRLDQAGCTPAIAAAWLGPRMNPDVPGFLGWGTNFAGMYEKAADYTGRIDLINELVLAMPPNRRFGDQRAEFYETLRIWGRTPYEPKRIRLFYVCGITPAEVQANPNLLDEHPDTLRTLAALRPRPRTAD